MQIVTKKVFKIHVHNTVNKIKMVFSKGDYSTFIVVSLKLRYNYLNDFW